MVAKSGENYYAQVRVNGERVLTVIQPLAYFDGGKTDAGGTGLCF
jgi:hypothetical protein